MADWWTEFRAFFATKLLLWAIDVSTQREKGHLAVAVGRYCVGMVCRDLKAGRIDRRRAREVLVTLGASDEALEG